MGESQTRNGRLRKREVGGVTGWAEDTENDHHPGFSSGPGHRRAWRLEACEQGCFGAQKHPGHALRQLPGKVDLSKTVEQLGLTDVQPCLPIEREATLYDLLTASFGVYLSTANADLTVLSPRRGSSQTREPISSTKIGTSMPRAPRLKS